MTETIPEGWEETILDNLISLMRNGINLKQSNSGETPITRIETISAETIDKDRVKYVDNVGDELKEKYTLKKNDILFSHINSVKHIGKTAQFNDEIKGLIHGINLLLLRPNKNVNPKFLLYELKKVKEDGWFIRIAKQAVNQASINTSELKKTKILLPPLPEQEKIADILSKTDEQIQLTEEIIAKTEELKKGLMQELLTKGIGHTEFKETELGMIPKEWDIIYLKDLFEIKNGTTPSTIVPKYWSEGNVNWFTPADMGKLKNDLFIGSSKRKITDVALNETNLTLMPEGSIMISCRAPVGYIAIFLNESTFNQGCKGLLKKEQNTNYSFYSYILLQSTKKLNSISGGSTFKELSKGALEKFKVVKPNNQDETKKIADILLGVDKQIQDNSSELQRLTELKKGLMQDLLSGKVRVKI